MAETFGRARTDEQRQVRRAQIMRVTRELLADRRVAEVSLNELARRAGLAKSSVMRYFTSREAILLVILEEDYGAWVSEVVADVADSSRAEDVEELAASIARAVLRYPLVCELLGCSTTVLERNVTGAEVIEYKLAMYAHMERLIDALGARLGAVPGDRCGALLVALHAVIVETWAIAHPAPALIEAAAVDTRVIPPPHDVVVFMANNLTLVLRGARVDGE